MAFSDPQTRRAFASAFKTFPTLETERLILSEILPEEADVYHQQQRSALEMAGRPPWGFGLEAESADQARRFILYAENAWKKKQSLRFGIRRKPEPLGESDATAVERAAAGATNSRRPSLIGMVTLFDFQNQYKAEIGYWLGAAHHGQGIMTEAVRAVACHAFGAMGMNRLYAHTSVENAPSLAMLRKVGFVQEGVLRQNTLRDGKWDDTCIMGLLKDDLTEASVRIGPDERPCGAEESTGIRSDWLAQ